MALIRNAQLSINCTKHQGSKTNMDNVTKARIIRLTEESIKAVRAALVAAVEGGVEAKGMAEYIRAINDLEDALDYFEDDDDNNCDADVTPPNIPSDQVDLVRGLTRMPLMPRWK